MLKGKHIVVGVCGGIAAYKTCELVSSLVKKGASVQVVMTKNACQFVTPLSFETLSATRVLTDTFDRNFTYQVEHISLARWADLFVVAPATANIVGKMSSCVCDDLLSTTLLATRKPILLCPAMNTGMLENPIFEEKLDYLVQHGIRTLFGEVGRLACGDLGRGRMAEPEKILSEIEKILDSLDQNTLSRLNGFNQVDDGAIDQTSTCCQLPADNNLGINKAQVCCADSKLGVSKAQVCCADSNLGINKAQVCCADSNLGRVQDFVGHTILVTAGATIEDIDGVRYVSNYSSGKMGVALANAALARGAKVILIVGNIHIPLPDCKVIRVKSTQDMYDAVVRELPQADIIIKAAAPADYHLETIAKNKIKAERLCLELVKNPDIAKKCGEIKGDRVLVVFCAETENLLENAARKLSAKNADLIVANDVTLDGAGFNTDTNIVSILDRKGNRLDSGLKSKAEIADLILDTIKTL